MLLLWLAAVNVALGDQQGQGLIHGGAVNCAAVKTGLCLPDAKAIKTLNNVDTAADCCDKCTKDDKCISFTFRAANQSHNDRPVCYFHPTNAKDSRPGHCTSAQVRDGPSPTPPTPPPPSPPLPPIHPAPKGARNVLFIISDDMRPDIAHKAFGQSFMKTPNLDDLASSPGAMVFQRAYCQQAICGPSRNSFMSGRRPQRTQSWNFIDSFREVGPDWLAFPEYFKTYNYTTLGGGKTYHPGIPKNDDQPYSWSQDRPYVNEGDGKCIMDYPNPSLVCPDNTGNYNFSSDYKNLQGMLQDFEYALTIDRPFFLNYGIHKPHLPWHMPQKFWDMYGPTEDIALPLHEYAPKDMPPIAFTYECDGKTMLDCFGESYHIPYPHNWTLPDNVTRSFRRGYYSALSWADYLIGEMTGALKKANKYDDAVVAFVGDHGWQLGEHNIWGKHTNFELGTRVPLIIKGPASMGSAQMTRTLVESVDIYPTVAILAGLTFPPDVDGYSLKPLWSNTSTIIKPHAFSEYPRCPHNISTPWDDTTSCVHTKRTNFTSMGYSIRSDTWRYTIWLHWDGENLVGDFNKDPIGIELYDHTGDLESDFDKFENVNVASDPSNAEVLKEMYQVALKQWSKNKTLTVL